MIIAKLYLYFGVIGLASILTWLGALAMLVNYARHARRTFFYARAVGLALAGLLLAHINSHYVSLIQVDRTLELEEAYQRQRRAQEAGWDTLMRRTAEIRFAEDSKKDRLHPLGVSVNKRSIYEQAAEGKNQNHRGQKDGKHKQLGGRTDTGAQQDEALEEEPGEEPSEKTSERQLPERDVLRANRLDKFNLWSARLALLMTLLLFGLDYLSRFNRTLGAVLPLPLPGRLVDSLFPKKYSVVLRAGQPDLTRRYLETIVRKGESFIYFGKNDVVPAALARIHIPLRDLWHYCLDVMRPVYLLQLASRWGAYPVAGRPSWQAWFRFPRFKGFLHHVLARLGQFARKVLRWMIRPLAGLAQKIIAHPWIWIRRRGKILLPAGQAIGAQVRKKCRPLQNLLNALRAGIVEFRPIAIIKPAAGPVPSAALSAPCSHNFIFECAWFQHYCFVIEDLGQSTAMLAALRAFLQRRLQPRATAAKTVHILWNFSAAAAPELLRNLGMLAKEVNVKLTVFAGEPLLAGLSPWVEEVWPAEAGRPGQPSLIAPFVSILRKIMNRLAGSLKHWMARRQTGLKVRLEKIKAQRAAKALAAKTAPPPSSPAPVKPEPFMAEPLPKTPAQPPPVAAPGPKIEKISRPPEKAPAPVLKAPKIPEIKLEPPKRPLPPILTPEEKKDAKQPPAEPPAAEAKAPVPPPPPVPAVKAPIQAPKVKVPPAPAPKPQPKVKIPVPPPPPPQAPVRAPSVKPKVKEAPAAPPAAPLAAPKPQPAPLPAQPEVEKKAEPQPPAPAPSPIVAVDEAANIFKFLCPRCKRKLAAQIDWQGKDILCPRCKEQITIPALS